MNKPLLDGDVKVPWEPVGQVAPKDLPDQAPEGYPAPWSIHGRGNGHFDIIASDDTYVAHVYVWDRKEMAVLQQKLAKINKREK